MNAPRRAHSSMPISEVLMIDRNGITKVSDRTIRKAMFNPKFQRPFLVNVYYHMS